MDPIIAILFLVSNWEFIYFQQLFLEMTRAEQNLLLIVKYKNEWCLEQ